MVAAVSAEAPVNVRYRVDDVNGPGGSQDLLEDPSGNIVELVRPRS
jgi:hypothetical protein